MPESKETISNPTAMHLPLPPNQVVTDPGGANLPSLAKLAAQAIQDKWQSTGGAPGAPKGDVAKSGTGFFRDYAGGRASTSAAPAAISSTPAENSVAAIRCAVYVPVTIRLMERTSF